VPQLRVGDENADEVLHDSGLVCRRPLVVFLSWNTGRKKSIRVRDGG
jgi:hypothetical protein